MAGCIVKPVSWAARRPCTPAGGFSRFGSWFPRVRSLCTSLGGSWGCVVRGALRRALRYLQLKQKSICGSLLSLRICCAPILVFLQIFNKWCPLNNIFSLFIAAQALFESPQNRSVDCPNIGGWVTSKSGGWNTSKSVP